MCPPLSWFTSAPVCPRDRKRLWLVTARGGETGRWSILYFHCVAVVGKGSACDSVVCLPCQRLAEQTAAGLGTALRSVYSAAWAGVRARAKGKGTLILHHHYHRPWRRELPTESAKNEAAARLGPGGEGRGSRDLFRCSCFSVQQLLLTAPPP